MRLLMPTLLLLFSMPLTAGNVRVVAQVAGTSAKIETRSGLAERPVDFWVDPLYPKIGNQKAARIEIDYMCIEDATGLINPNCHITLNTPVARENTGGHFAGHAEDRPTGKHVPDSGWVDERTGKLRTTFYATEVAGISDVRIDCTLGGFGTCRPGAVTIGVATRGFVELLPGPGYVLVGSKAPHPSNHWGNPEFVQSVAIVAAKYASKYPEEVLQYNDISLPLGGVFDVRTRSDPGYDWTPPHKTHRLGTNMDIGIPADTNRQNFLESLYRLRGISVHREDRYHWHLL